MDELLILLKAVLNVKAEPLTEEKIVGALSYDLRWFQPGEAKRIVGIMIERGYLKKSREDVFTVTSIIDNVTLPLMYMPNREKIVELLKPQPLAIRLATYISNHTGKKINEVIAEGNKLQEIYNIHLAVALLLIAKELKLNIKEYIPAIRDELKIEN